MQDIHGIRPPVPVGMDPMLIKNVLLVLAGVLLCALLFFLIKKWWKKKQEPNNLKYLPEPLPPYESALKALDRLGIDPVNDPRLFYFNLTLILRKYVGGSFKVNAAEMTSQEFIRQIRLLDMDKAVKHKIAQFHHDTDPIKYAGICPENSRTQTDLLAVRDVIGQIEADLAIEARKQQENH